ncbi:hypothetical protein ACLOJK_024597 [Asimina triloba]
MVGTLPTLHDDDAEDEKEFNYIEGSGKGPEHWGEIHKEWAMCKNGEMQSPIDLSNQRVLVVPGLGKLDRSYKSANAILKNRGHDIMGRFKSMGLDICLNRFIGTHLLSTQSVAERKPLHFSPDARKRKGVMGTYRYELEVHMVHESLDKKVAVVGIMYKFGRPDTFLSELTEHIESIADSHEAEREVGVVDPRHVKIGSRMYYRYIGSLTVPPCDQGVMWTIVRKIRTVSREQVRVLRRAVSDDAERNARPTQAINKRMIHLYRPQIVDGDGS